MSIIAIIYYSGAGHTEKMAQAIAKGVMSVAGADAQVIAIQGTDIQDGRYVNKAVMTQLEASDAIIFGSPTYMGGPAAQFKAFADASIVSWAQQAWQDKLAAGFTVSGTPSGDKFSTLQYFHTLAMQHGMLWVSLGERPMQANGVNRLASWGGAMAETIQQPGGVAINTDDALTGEALGRRVATLALRYQQPELAVSEE